MQVVSPDYNDGKIEFTKDSEAITVKSVSSIIVGNNYVGGVAGFNDVNGELAVHYTLIGGRVYGYEDAVGWVLRTECIGEGTE